MKKRPGTPGRFSCRKMPVPAVPGLPPHSLLRPAPARLFRGTSLRPPAFPRTLFPNLCPDDAHAPHLRSLPPPFPSRSGCFPDSSRAFPPLPAFFLHTPALPPFPGSRLSVPLLSSAARLFPLSLSFFPRRALSPPACGVFFLLLFRPRPFSSAVELTVQPVKFTEFFDDFPPFSPNLFLL